MKADGRIKDSGLRIQDSAPLRPERGGGFRKSLLTRWILLAPGSWLLNPVLLLLLLTPALHAQQVSTQTQATVRLNVKYVQGVGIGYAPTAGAGLTLNLASGTAFCSGAIANYAGGTLAVTNNTTNYVYLDTAASCVPASNTTGFTSATVPIGTVVTLTGAITTITDQRSMFNYPPAISGLTTNTVPKATSATAIGNSLYGDDATTGTYTGTGGFSALSFNSTDPHDSNVSFTGGASGDPGVTASTFKLGIKTGGVVAAGWNWYVDASAQTTNAGLPYVGAPAANKSAFKVLELAAHAVPVGFGTSAPQAKVVPDCTDTGGNHLNYTQSSDAFSCGTSSTGGVSAGSMIGVSGSTVSFNPLDTTVLSVRDDFCGGVSATSGSLGEQGWGLSLIGATGTAVSHVVGATPNLCILRLTTSATTARGGDINLGTNVEVTSLGALGNTTNLWDSKFVFSMSATAQTSVYVGFTGTFGSYPPSNFIGLRFDTSATSPAADTTDFRFVTCKTTTCVAHGTTYTADTNFHTVRIRQSVAGTFGLTLDANAEICLNSGGTAGCTTDAQIPTGTLTAIFEQVQQSGVSQTMDIDFFAFIMTGLAR